MRVTPETFIKDSSPGAQCAWQRSFSGTPRAGKYTPVTQLWIKTGLGGHLRTHTKHVWGSQAFLSKASWMFKTLIECILRNALGSHIWHSSFQTPQEPAGRATSTLSSDTAEFCTEQWLQAHPFRGKATQLLVLLPLVQQHTGATQQCLTSWGMTDYTTSLSWLEFAVPSLNIKTGSSIV